MLEEGCLALRCRDVLLEKRRQRQAELELDSIAFHAATSSTGHNISTGGAGGRVVDQLE